MAYGITDAGVVIKTLLEIETSINNEYKSRIGAGANTRSQSVLGIIRDIAANGESELWEKIQDVYNQMTIAATGNNLDQVAALSGKRRVEATNSKIKDLLLEVSGNLNLSAGFAFSKSGEEDIKYTLDTALSHTYTGPGNEWISVDVTCTTTGEKDISSTDGSISVIDSPTSNLVSVKNGTETTVWPVAGSTSSVFVDGINEETDDELRVRIQNDPFITVTGTDSGIRRRVLALNEIENSGYETILNCLVVSNRDLTTDGDGRPGKSTEVIVYYGSTDADTDQAVARAILNAAQDPSKFVSTTGTSYSETVTLDGGNTRDVVFSRPTEVPIYVDVKVAKASGNLTSGSPDSEKEILKAAIAAWGNNLGLAEDIVVYGRDSFSEVLNDFATVAITDYEIGVDTSAGPTPGTDDNNITIGTTEISTWDVANITISDF